MRKALTFLFVAAAFGLLMIALSAPAGQAYASLTPPTAPDWQLSPPGKLLSSGAPGAQSPDLAIRPGGSEMMVVYDHWVTSNNNKDPYFTLSTNNGTTWSAPQPIHTSSNVDSFDVNVAYGTDGRAHAVWVNNDEAVPNATGQLLYSRRVGGSWSGTPVTLSSITSPLPIIAEPDIAATGTSTIDIVWSEGNPFGGGSNPNIWYIRSIDGGQTWGTKARVALHPGSSRLPTLAVTNDGLRHVAWAQNVEAGEGNTVIHYAQGVPSGTAITWTPAITLSVDIPVETYSSTQPKLVAYGNDLYLTFTRSEIVNQGTGDRIQWVVYMHCDSGCDSIANWSQAIIASGEDYPVEVTEQTPFDLISSPVYAGGCPFAFYHGATSATFFREVVWDVNGCDSWYVRGQDMVTNESTRVINPSAAAKGNEVHLVYEWVDTAQVQGNQIYWTFGKVPSRIFMPISVDHRP